MKKTTMAFTLFEINELRSENDYVVILTYIIMNFMKQRI